MPARWAHLYAGGGWCDQKSVSGRALAQLEFDGAWYCLDTGSPVPVRIPGHPVPLTHTRRPIPASLVLTISRDTPKVTS